MLYFIFIKKRIDDGLCGDEFDKKFIATFAQYFDEYGLLAGTTFICKSCCNQLPKEKRIRKGSELSSVSMEIDFDVETDLVLVETKTGDLEVDNLNVMYTPSAIKVEDETFFPFVPKESLLFGLWTGPIPAELMGLTVIEVSMISIYSCLTKFSLHGKYYHTKSATSFTVVNDVTKIFLQLPVMPTAESTGILRAKNTNSSKDFTYRPNKVFYALKWYKENNHLYKDLPPFLFPDLNVPVDINGNKISWEHCSTEIEPEVFELTDEDILEIDESYVSNELPDETTNTGF